VGLPAAGPAPIFTGAANSPVVWPPRSPLSGHPEHHYPASGQPTPRGGLDGRNGPSQLRVLRSSHPPRRLSMHSLTAAPGARGCWHRRGGGGAHRRHQVDRRSRSLRHNRPAQDLSEPQLPHLHGPRALRHAGPQRRDPGRRTSPYAWGVRGNAGKPHPGPRVRDGGRTQRPGGLGPLQRSRLGEHEVPVRHRGASLPVQARWRARLPGERTGRLFHGHRRLAQARRHRAARPHGHQAGSAGLEGWQVRRGLGGHRLPQERRRVHRRPGAGIHLLPDP